MKLIIYALLLSLTTLGNGAPAVGWKPYSVDYPMGVVLDNEDRVWLYWMLEPDTQTILMEVHAKTLGWFGVGFSPNGAMTASDIVVGWVDTNGVPHLTDRHASANGFPPMDLHQDYEIVGGAKNSTHTIISFRRMMDTCDPNDYPIGDDTMHVLYAVSDHLPSNDNDIQKHELHNRGNRAVYFKDSAVGDPDAPLGPDVQYMDFMSNNVSIPEDYHTLYWCHIFKLPQLGKQHMIRSKPIVQPGNEPYVHHMVLYSCTKDMTEWVDKEEPCFDRTGTHFSAMYQCTSKFLAVWAVGGQTHNYPEGVGYPMFESTGDKFVMLEMHYDNSAYSKNIRDSSGLRIYYTNQFRPVEAATMIIGAPVGPLYQTIPPGQKTFINYAYCTSDCTNSLPAQGLQFFSGFLHTHLLGYQIRLRHIRNGVELPPPFEDNNYDFNYQEIRTKLPPTQVLPGDEFILECVLDSTSRTGTTYSGFSTQNEMCLVYIQYYPRIQGVFEACMSYYDPKEALGVLGAKDINYETLEVENSQDQWIPLQEWIATEVDWGANDAPDRYAPVRQFQDIIRDGTNYVMCSSQDPDEQRSRVGKKRPATAVVERLHNRDVIHMGEDSKLKSANGNSREYHVYTQKGMPNIITPYVRPNICLAQNNTTAVPTTAAPTTAAPTTAAPTTAPVPSTSTPQKPSTAGGRLEVSTILALASLLISIFIGFRS